MLQCVEKFGARVESLLLNYKKDIINQQCVLNRLSQATFDIYTMAVVLSRCTRTLEMNLPTAEYEEKLVKIWCHCVSIKILLE